MVGRVIVSHRKLMAGDMRKNEKYTAVATCPIRTYGSSTGRAPIQVRIRSLATMNQNIIWDGG